MYFLRGVCRLAQSRQGCSATPTVSARSLSLIVTVKPPICDCALSGAALPLMPIGTVNNRVRRTHIPFAASGPVTLRNPVRNTTHQQVVATLLFVLSHVWTCHIAALLSKVCRPIDQCHFSMISDCLPPSSVGVLKAAVSLISGQSHIPATYAPHRHPYALHFYAMAADVH